MVCTRTLPGLRERAAIERLSPETHFRPRDLAHERHLLVRAVLSSDQPRRLLKLLFESSEQQGVRFDSRQSERFQHNQRSENRLTQQIGVKQGLKPFERLEI